MKDLYPFARAEEMIRLTRGFYPNWDYALERRLIDEFEIPLRMKCPKLSKGTKAKLYLLLALCRRPELLVLDEPTEGLDPIAIEQTLRLLVEQVAERGATVFFSSHQLPEVEQVADYVVMIKHGRCVVEGELDGIKQCYRRVRCVMETTDAKLPLSLSTLASRGPLPHRVLRGRCGHTQPAAGRYRCCRARIGARHAEGNLLRADGARMTGLYMIWYRYWLEVPPAPVDRWRSIALWIGISTRRMGKIRRSRQSYWEQPCAFDRQGLWTGLPSLHRCHFSPG